MSTILDSLLVLVLASVHPVRPVPGLDGTMAFGFLTTLLAFVLYFYRRQSRSTLRLFAVSLAATAIYGLLDQAWALAVISGMWSVEAFRESVRPQRVPAASIQIFIPRRIVPQAVYAGGAPAGMSSESRISRMFGSTG